MIRIDTDFRGNAFNGQTVNIVRQEFGQAMRESLLLLEQEVVNETPVNFGILRSGIGGRMTSAFKGVVGVTGPAKIYGPFVEEGRSPGRFPPIDAIILWVRRKLKVDPAKVRSVGYLVARKIAEKGTSGAFMFQKAERKMKSIIIRRFQVAADRIGRRLS